MSLRRVRSPAAPKITMMHGSPGFPITCVLVAGIASVTAMASISFQFDVPAELLAHCRQHLLCEGMLLPRAEANKEGCRQHVDRHGFVDRGLDRPATFARV